MCCVYALSSQDLVASCLVWAVAVVLAGVRGVHDNGIAILRLASYGERSPCATEWSTQELFSASQLGLETNNSDTVASLHCFHWGHDCLDGALRCAKQWLGKDFRTHR